MKIQLCSSAKFSGVNLYWSERHITGVKAITAFLASASLNSGTINVGTMYSQMRQHGQRYVARGKPNSVSQQKHQAASGYYDLKTQDLDHQHPNSLVLLLKAHLSRWESTFHVSGYEKGPHECSKFGNPD
ncbi:hypothetical protein [Parasitella parasitica]|uniref:Uncharacterized protein n=1 Tax=Parasitella parasitica TaxID=35722 RepID=A0A0B7NM50_9FUNG|nr:hypothetical protein [Parasitella parasitica]